MNSRKIVHFLASAVLATGLIAAGLSAKSPPGSSQPRSAAQRQIEVCFVLDTTSSMGGLIEGAKAKIWSIANQMIAAKPAPKLEIALIGYRDRGDEYVTRIFDLTEDLDAMYGHLREFSAVGGGDESESVNLALHEAVTKIDWSSDRDVLKIIFLVGDSPPHMDYANDIKYAETCRLAVKKDLIVNTVQCGVNSRTTPIWQEIARLSEGSFVAIGQTGDMQVVSTPMDKELSELNVAIGTTLVPYGREEQKREVNLKQAAAERAGAPAAADRLAYNVARGRGVQGNGDLVDDLKEGKVALDTLKKEELPAEMQKMTAEQQQEFLKQQAEKRGRLQAKIAELLKQRQGFLDAELKKLAQTGKGSAFDVQVTQLLRDQARRKGIEYDGATTTRPAESP